MSSSLYSAGYNNIRSDGLACDSSNVNVINRLELTTVVTADSFLRSAMACAIPTNNAYEGPTP